MLEQFISKFSRNLFIIPGGYYLVKFFIKIFSLKNYSKNSWRTYEFQGLVFKVDIHTYLGKLMYWRGAHEWGPILAMKKIIKSGGICIDVGANQGEYTLWMAKLSSDSGKVISFEPLTKMYNQLIENIDLNPNLSQKIITIKKGLSDHVSELPLYAVNASDNNSDNEGMPSIFHSDTRNTFIENIALSTLDIELKKMNINKVNFIKIDVEGAELLVLKGAADTLNKSKPNLLIEFNEQTFNAAGYTSNDIFNFLEPFGYRFYIIGIRGNLKACNKNSIPPFCNIIATI
ncbi:MAG: hypothetical protein KatS3mg035_0419 [Bacteroidia bacterium]|nr:MAG: hypothetical protein KatS3mg035_0419 [Bacteroidia bacterium]